jgi:hypothetical protein
MQTYQFTAFRSERFAANGVIQAESPEDARAKLIERHQEQGLNFRDYVDGGEPDHFMLIDEAGEDHHFEETTPDLRAALRALIDKADDLIAAIEGATDQFEREVSALSAAASAAEKALAAGGES